jgi:hypothetical protein
MAENGIEHKVMQMRMLITPMMSKIDETLNIIVRPNKFNILQRKNERLFVNQSIEPLSYANNHPFHAGCLTNCCPNIPDVTFSSLTTETPTTWSAHSAITTLRGVPPYWINGRETWMSKVVFERVKARVRLLVDPFWQH